MSEAILRRVAWAGLGVLCLQFVALGLVQAWRDAPTYDEAYHLAAGVTALTRHQLRMTPEHPPLPHVLAAVPVLLAHPTVPDGPSWRAGDSETYAGEFIRAQSASGDLQRVMLLNRLVPLLEGIAVGLLAYALATRLFGRAAGMLAAVVWFTLPFAVGFAHLNGVDLPFALVTLVLAHLLLSYLRTPSTRVAGLIGVVCGVALTTRFTALVLVPVAAVVVATVGGRTRQRAAAHAALVLTTAWASVWVVYRALSPVPKFRHADFPFAGSIALPLRLVIHLPWPAEFGYGLEKQAFVAKTPAPAYLLGHSWTGARWWFWPGSMLVKLPVTTLIVLVLGIACWWGLGRRTVREAAIVLGVPAAALLAVVVGQPRPLGLRYLLPVIALGIVAGSPLVRIARSVSGQVAIAVLVGAQLFWLWESAPQSFAWTAPPFRPGYRFASDSNLDWGQDLYRLHDWARDHPDVVVLYFGVADVQTEVPHARPLFDFVNASALPTGWWAVSASYVNNYYKTGLVPWLRAYCPVGVVGDSILLYRFPKPPDTTVPPPEKPRGFCRGDYSVA